MSASLKPRKETPNPSWCWDASVGVGGGGGDTLCARVLYDSLQQLAGQHFNTTSVLYVESSHRFTFHRICLAVDQSI